jgi:hypothetical protein
VQQEPDLGDVSECCEDHVLNGSLPTKQKGVRYGVVSSKEKQRSRKKTALLVMNAVRLNS